MNKQKAMELKNAVARAIKRTGKDIDLKHSCRLARRMWTDVPTTRRTDVKLQFVAMAAVAKAYEVGMIGGTWTPWQRIRKVFVPRSKYAPATEDKKHKEQAEAELKESAAMFARLGEEL